MGRHRGVMIIRSSLQYPHYSYRTPCKEDTFLEDDWVPRVIRVIHVSPSDKAGQRQCLLAAAVHSGAGSVITTYLQRWKQDTHWELLKGVEGRVMVLYELSAREFCLPNQGERPHSLWLLAHGWWQAICWTNYSVHIIMWLYVHLCYKSKCLALQTLEYLNRYRVGLCSFTPSLVLSHTIYTVLPPSPSACIYSINGSQ